MDSVQDRVRALRTRVPSGDGEHRHTLDRQLSMFQIFRAVLLFAAVHDTGQHLAWWVTATFDPRESAIEGLPVEQLQSAWTRASVLRSSMLPAEAGAPGESVADHDAALSIETDLDGDGRPERAVVGVFETRTGQTGRFLLILGRARAKVAWRKRAVFTIVGPPGFSAVDMRDGHLHWLTCFECDTGCEVTRRSGRFRLRCYSCC